MNFFANMAEMVCHASGRQTFPQMAQSLVLRGKRRIV